MIKKFTLLFSVLLLAVSCSDSPKPVKDKIIRLKIKGSDTMYSLTKLLCNSFQQQNKNYQLTCEGGGTTAGIADLIAGKIDVAAASRELKTTEKETISRLKKSFETYIIAYDGLVVIVNAQNKIGKITREQLEAIYLGKITNWKELGEKKEKILVYALDKSNSVDEFFCDKIMGEKNYSPLVNRLAKQKDILKKVAANKGAIAYYPILQSSSKINSLSVSYDSSKTFIAPTLFNFQNRSYPISRALYYFADASKEAEMNLFMEYTKSLLGKRNISEMGFIPVQ